MKCKMKYESQRVQLLETESAPQLLKEGHSVDTQAVAVAGFLSLQSHPLFFRKGIDMF